MILKYTTPNSKILMTPSFSAVEQKATLMAATFLIDYLHFTADPGDDKDSSDEDWGYLEETQSSQECIINVEDIIKIFLSI